MFVPESSPCLCLTIDPLTTAESDGYAIWVWKAPYSGGIRHLDQRWTPELTAIWQHWRNVFHPSDDLVTLPPMVPALPPLPPNMMQAGEKPVSYTSRLMQQFGVSLWEWLFAGIIESVLRQSQGIAMGQERPLRLRLAIHAPDLVPIPWEILMQPTARVASLNPQLLFSRTTTNDVGALPSLRTDHTLNILLVLGQDAAIGTPQPAGSTTRLQLQQEADVLTRLLEGASTPGPRTSAIPPVQCQVTTLIEPTPAQLLKALETGVHNVLFYAGHGVPAPDGGMLFLRPDATINGTELAQVLTRCHIKLAVFNACWGAQPAQQGNQTIPHSSLAEVLIHHGVPAVLGMRDAIGDQEAIAFIQAFAQALAQRAPIEEAVAMARRSLFAVYGFNSPVWTLPVLYLHPEFDGELIKPIVDSVTEMPDNAPNGSGRQIPSAFLRALLTPTQIWPIRGGMMRVGREEGNDLVLPSVAGVSREHAEIFYRDSAGQEGEPPSYLLRDRSRYGTYLSHDAIDWQPIHHQDVPLQSGMKLKFGNFQFEFVIEDQVAAT